MDAVLLETRSLPDIYAREKWHVDRMHPSRVGHQFIADSFAALLRLRGFAVGEVHKIQSNNRSRKDSIMWLLRNGTPWFLKRSVDLLPAMLLLMATELIRDMFSKDSGEYAEVIYPEFGLSAGASHVQAGEWVS
jgi:hypothetical protein